MNRAQIAKAVRQPVQAKRDTFYRRVRLMLRGKDPEALKSGIKNLNAIKFGNVKDDQVAYFSHELNPPRRGRPLFVSVSPDDAIEEERTIVVEGGHLVIGKNVVADGGKLGIIVLKDEKGRGGKVYISKDVKDLHANIFADSSEISLTNVR